MQKRIFYAIFLVCFFLLFIANIFLLYILESFFIKEALNDLKKQANTIKNTYENFLQADIRQTQKELKSFKTQYRITIIAKSGEVLFDNFQNSQELDNHLNRKEVQNAFLRGDDFAMRYSDSLKENLIYYAQSFSHQGKDLVLRVATTKANIRDLLRDIFPYFVLELMFCLILCFFVARFLSFWILKPIKTLDLEHIKNDDLYQELHSFVKKIKAQNKTIKAQYKILEQRQQEIYSLVQNVNNAIVLLNHQGEIILHNQSAKRYLSIEGFKRIFELGDCEFVNRILESLNNFKSNKNRKNKAFSLTLKGNECEILLSPIFTKNKLKGLLIFIENSNDKDLTQALRKEFSANVTHELKTPLTSILASSEMLKNNWVNEKDIPQFANRIYLESKRLLEMIDEILKLSFFDENRQDSLKKEKVNLQKVVLLVFLLLENVAKKYKVRLEHNLQNVEILGIADMLENLIYNLCDNAIKYNKEDGFVRVSLQNTKDKILLCIQDNGIGIPKEAQERIFERFFCVDKSRSKKLGGTGLGLSIVKSTCFYHKAEIKVKSELGMGSEFVIAFNKNCEFKQDNS